MDAITLAEAFLFIEAYELKEQNEWRRARYVAWASLRANSTKEFKPEDLFELRGDKKETVKRSGISYAEHMALVQKYKKHQDGINRAEQIGARVRISNKA